MFRKIVCLAISAIMLFGAFACGEKPVSDTSGGGGPAENTGEQGSTAPEKEDQRQKPDVPDRDFEGYDFKIYSKGPVFNEWASLDIDAEEENGEPINDAVYRRNRFVEEKYNVNVMAVPSANGDMVAAVKKAVSAGDDIYDAAVPNMYSQATLATGGNLTDLKHVPYLDLSKKWWDQKANADLTINNKLLFTVGDLFIMDNDATWLVIFNKELIRELALENPYEIVRGGKWSFDKLLSMGKGVAKDVNGDGIMDRSDFYGMVDQGESMTAYYLAAGEKYIKKDASDLPFTQMDTERSLSVIEKIFELMYDNTMSYNYWDITGETEPYKLTQAMFENNQAVFKITALQLVIRMRNMETNFGIIPMPKYELTQKDYAHYVHPTASALSIPTTNNNLERTGIILEALAAESYYTVRPAYYEISINGKFLRDEESIEMLDIILASRVYELAEMYGWGGLGSVLVEMYRPKKRDFVSTYEKKKDSYKKAIDKTIVAFE